MPHEWQVLLQTSGISKNEVIENSQAVLDVLNFQDQYAKQVEQKVAKPGAPAAKPPQKQQPASIQHHDANHHQEEEIPSQPLPEERNLTLSKCICLLFTHPKKMI